MEPIRPTTIRYIKLGQGGQWVDACLSRGEIHFGYRAVPPHLCSQGAWDQVAHTLIEAGTSPRKVKNAVREIRDFYTLGPDCLWITLARGSLWWTFARDEVTWAGNGTDMGARVRRTISAWRNTSIKGHPLTIDSLSSKLTQVARFQGTICRIKDEDYLLRRINNLENPSVCAARRARQAMIKSATTMIADLHWADFETLVDLVFARAGWERISRLGGQVADVDLVLRQPTTGETAFVQIKSRASQRVLNDYIERFDKGGVYDRMFFVCHSPQRELAAPAGGPIHLWVGDRLAEIAIKAGLFDWLLERSL